PIAVLHGPDALSRSRKDQVSGHQREDGRAVGDEGCYREDHVACMYGLAYFAIDLERQGKILRILDFVGLHQWPERSERVKPFRYGTRMPLCFCSRLQITCRHV